jgi:hypothetical protein
MMTSRSALRLSALLGAVCMAVGTAGPAPAADVPKALAFFETKVRPVLAEHCYRCHGPAKQRGGLRLDSRAALLAGGDQGPAISPGHPERSLLLRAVRHEGDVKMPPKSKLARPQIDALARWVKLGAPWPGAEKAPAPVRTTAGVTDRDRSHWAFRPVRRPPVPAVKARQRVANPIDAFVLARLEAKGLSLSPPATPRELVRRAYFDLIGLPPTPEEVDAFARDRRADAWPKLLARLLARPQYGERWGRHWLDVVRFAQSNGYERDSEKPFAWRYRDYVIGAFNADKPYDQLVREQIAGDELDAVTDDARTATAFYRLGVWDDEPDDARQAEFDDLDDVVSTAGAAFLGLSLGCARCHDHKFDPIPQEDYYSLLAFFRNIQPFGLGKDPVGKKTRTSILLPLDAGGFTLAVRERPTPPPPTHVLIRGNAGSPGKKVEPRFPRVLCRSDEAARPTLPAGGRRRRALAEWLARPDNPLTARVLVNRLWQHHFGQGLVSTPNDFGRNGAAPSHPELLDWLASELVAGGWRLKRIHELILRSNTYRQSARVASAGLAVDPGNVLLWRQNLRRLEAEAIRDAVLAVSGSLNLQMGGRGVFPNLPPEVLSTQSRPGDGWGKSSPHERARRSVYVFVKRTLLVPILETFDFASPDKSIAERTTTTIAPQALILLNSAFVEEQAGAFADRLLKEGGADAGRNVERAFRLALGRGPTARERELALAYLARARQQVGGSLAGGYRAALARLCKVVLNLNEFVYVD